MGDTAVVEINGREDEDETSKRIDLERWVQDSSVDYKGRVPRRSTTGSWRSSILVIALEFSERLVYYGLMTNLIIYLTTVLQQDVKTAAQNINNWNGVLLVSPLVGGLIADAYLGRFRTVMAFTNIYLLGLNLLIMTQMISRLKPCDPRICHRSLYLHEAIFFAGLYVIAIGSGGLNASLQSFGADQFDDNHAEERKKKMSFFNWWNFGQSCGLILGSTMIGYVQINQSWKMSYIILINIMGITFLLFAVGKSCYRYQVPRGSPLTPLLQVIVAAIEKRHVPLPDKDDELYEIHDTKRRLLSHTRNLRFLDKAAIIEHKDDETATDAERTNPWRLATVTQVEELKVILSMVPIWLVSLPISMSIAQVSTFFIKQAAIMDRKTINNFDLPPPFMFAIGGIAMIISVIFYDRVLEPLSRKATTKERGITMLKRIGIGMVFSVLGMVAAAIVERKRLNVAEREKTEVVTMSVFWLVPQFVILGFGDGFTLVGLQEYFYDQVPDNMRSLGIGLSLALIGLGSFLSSLLITIVDKLTSTGGNGSWFAPDLNKSRLDLFYWLLAVINLTSVCFYVLIASRYSYKNVKNRDEISYHPEDYD